MYTLNILCNTVIENPSTWKSICGQFSLNNKIYDPKFIHKNKITASKLSHDEIISKLSKLSNNVDGIIKPDNNGYRKYKCIRLMTNDEIKNNEQNEIDNTHNNIQTILPTYHISNDNIIESNDVANILNDDISFMFDLDREIKHIC